MHSPNSLLISELDADFLIPGLTASVSSLISSASSKLTTRSTDTFEGELSRLPSVLSMLEGSDEISFRCNHEMKFWWKQSIESIQLYKGQLDVTLRGTLGLKVLRLSIDTPRDTLTKIIAWFYPVASKSLLIIFQTELKINGWPAPPPS